MPPGSQPPGAGGAGWPQRADQKQAAVPDPRGGTGYGRNPGDYV